MTAGMTNNAHATRADRSVADTTEKIAEIGSILAAGLQRVLARKSTTLIGRSGDISLPVLAPDDAHEPRSPGQERGHDR
jgi:hypothetical protein